MLRSVTSRARTAERPSQQTDAVNMPKRPHVIHRGSDIVPVRGERGQLMRIARLADRWNQTWNQRGLLLARQVAWIVHRRRPRGAAISSRVHREYVESGFGEVGHPTVVLVRDIECDLRRRSGAVY